MTTALAEERSAREAAVSALRSEMFDNYGELAASINMMADDVRLLATVRPDIAAIKRELRGGNGDGPDSLWSLVNGLSEQMSAVADQVQQQGAWIERVDSGRRTRQRVAVALLRMGLGNWRIAALVAAGLTSYVISLVLHGG